MITTRFLGQALLAMLLVAGAVAGCADGGDQMTLDECSDGVDNDSDGKIDGVDPACAAGRSQESQDPQLPPACQDGIDNDNDGVLDDRDPGCTDVDDPDESNPKLPACDDDVDNDGDGFIDYPRDPGCLAPNQDTEADDCPDGPRCPQCSNGRDDDGDGDTDFPADSDCDTASGSYEAVIVPAACGDAVVLLDLPPSGRVTGQLGTGASDLHSDRCNGPGDEDVYELVIGQPVSFSATTVSTQTAANTVLSLRDSTCQTELTCNDDAGNSTTSSSIAAQLEPGVYYLVVDAAFEGAGGHYELIVDRLLGAGAPCDPAQPACGADLICRQAAGGTGPTCEPTVCADGRDDDADGTIDYPEDPGCIAEADDSEVDDCPTGPGCPACGNGVDDDGDGAIDFPDDGSCDSASASRESCATELDPLLVVNAHTVVGTTAGATSDFVPVCRAGTTAPDRVAMLQLPVPVTSLTIDTVGSAFDTVISLLPESCSGDAIVCNNDGGGGTASKIHLGFVAAGAYAIVVDGNNTASGPFVLNVRATVPEDASCTSPLFATGVLACPEGMACDGTGCVPAACSDDVDADGDGHPGFPTDPGCTDISDGTEEDDCPTGASCPVCSNGRDDDGDGHTDYPDAPGCISAAGTSEACEGETEPLLQVAAATTTGSTAGATNDFVPTCQTGSTAPDRVHILTLPVPVDALSVTTVGSSFDTVLSIIPPTCQGSALACNDDGAGAQSAVSLTGVAAGSYAIVVDGYGTANGNYTLNVVGTVAPLAACTSPLFAAGVLACPANYACDGAICAPGPCNDQIDQDGDGHVGYPTDPGCTGIDDATEADDCPSGAGCPVCSNGLDDDGDGHADYPRDPDCRAASAGSEACSAERDALATVGAPVSTGTTAGANNDFAPSCQTGSNAADRVHILDLPVAVATLRLSTEDSTFDTVLSVLPSSCSGALLACDDDGGTTPETSSVVTMTNVAAGGYAIVVDGYQTQTGPYTLRVTGTVVAGTACDSPLFDAGVLACPTSFACDGGVCAPAACNDSDDDDGDGYIGFPTDPGCTSTDDGTEDDDCPDGPNCPQCANGLDDDGDGRIDFGADLGCSSASSTSEIGCTSSADPIRVLGEPTVFASTTTALRDDFDLACGTNGRDEAWLLDVPFTLSKLNIDTIGSALDTVVELRAPSCTSASMGCDDNGAGNGDSRLALTNVAAGSYFVIVDDRGTAGAYQINVSGIIADGNRCSPTIEDLGLFTCKPGSSCGGAPGAEVCVP